MEPVERRDNAEPFSCLNPYGATLAAPIDPTAVLIGECKPDALSDPTSGMVPTWWARSSANPDNIVILCPTGRCGVAIWPEVD